ncbi:unnamed protein product, partial [Rotaria sp. Silwood1]
MSIAALPRWRWRQ